MLEPQHPRRRIWSRRLIVVAAVQLAILVMAGMATAGPTINWPTYLLNSEHGSASTATSITPQQAQLLNRTWQFTADASTQAGAPGKTFYASPTVFDEMVFIGSNTGVFYALDLNTGAVVWQRFLGFQKAITCSAHGIVSTAAVAPDPISGSATVYVGGGDGYVYALDAATGAVKWRSVVGESLPSKTTNDIYNWASPAVVNGRVYMGVSSNCDQPWVRGGLQAFDQVDGTLLASYWGVPSGAVGAGVWTSPAVDAVTGDVYVTTASGPNPPAPQGDDFSIVRLDGTTLVKQGIWTVPLAARPVDADFASSPTLFHASVQGVDEPLVAACNKNGVLYAWQRDNIAAGPVWQLKVGLGTAQGVKACLAAPIWNGSRLFEASNPTSVQGVPYNGSVRALDPQTGMAQWETGLGGIVLGSPSMSAGGVIAAPEFKTDTGTTIGLPLIDASTGKLVNFLTGLGGFAQPVFADDGVLVATGAGTLSYYQPRTSGDAIPPSAPSLTVVRSADGATATLSWPTADVGQGVSGYRVFRDGALIKTLAPNATSYTDPALNPVMNYSYFLQAVDATGNTSVQSPLRLAPKPAGAPLFADGFESGTLNLWQGNLNMAVQQQVVHSGSWAAKDVNRAFVTGVLAQPTGDVYVRLWFQVAAQGASPLDLLTINDDAGRRIAKARLSTSGQIQLQGLNPTAKTWTSAVVPTKNAWHSLEVHLSIGAKGSIEAWLDGTPVPGVSQTWNFGTSQPDQVQIGDPVTGRHVTTYLDDVVASTAPIGP